MIKLTDAQRVALSWAVLIMRGEEQWLQLQLERDRVFTGPGTTPLELAGYRSITDGIRELFLFPGDMCALGFASQDEADEKALRAEWTRLLAGPHDNVKTSPPRKALL